MHLICRPLNLFILHRLPHWKLSLMNYSSAETCATQMKMTSIEPFRFRPFICSSFIVHYMFDLNLLHPKKEQNQPTDRPADNHSPLISLNWLDSCYSWAWFNVIKSFFCYLLYICIPFPLSFFLPLRVCDVENQLNSHINFGTSA